MQTNAGGSYPSLSQPTHVWDYWAVVMKRIILVILFCLVCVGAAYFVTQRQQKLYRATSTIQILPPSVLGTTNAIFTPAIVNDEVYLATQLAILTTPETIERAVQESGLETAKDFQGMTQAEIAKLAFGRIECTRRRGVYLVDVSVIGPDPKVLDELCNALVKSFQSTQRSESKKLREDRKSAIEAAIQTSDTNIKMLAIDKTGLLTGANFAISTFEQEYEKIQASRERFGKIDDELYADLMEREPVVSALKEARKDASKWTEAIARDPFIVSNAKVKEVDDRILQWRDDRDAKLRGGLGENDERIRAIDDQIERAVKMRARVIDEQVSSYILEFENMSKKHESLRKQIELKTQELSAAARVKQLVEEKDAEIRRNEANRDAAIRQREILEQHAVEEKDAVKVESPAGQPVFPYSPNTVTNMTMGLVLGVVGGVALAFLLDYLDDTIRTKDELAKIAPDVPLLGIVPNIEARKSEVAKKDLFAANQPKSTISEAYRGVRTALTLSARGPQQKAMLLTSAGPREGKTTTAINLATVLAFSGARTLIVDADLRKPRVHASFGLENRKGLTNLIVGEDDPADYCQHTQVDRVDVLTSGPIPPNPSELLGRPRMREILRKLRERYDHIIVDTPPIGAVTDAAVIATMVDGVILVVHAGKTRRQIVSRGIEQLRYISAPIIGVILNNLHLGRGRYYPGYYHYYYYYASHYGAEDGDSKKAKSGKSPPPPKAPAPPEAPVGGL